MRYNPIRLFYPIGLEIDMYRSRLQRVEEKRNVNKAVWLILLTVVILGVAVVGGIPLLVKLAVFIGDINSSRRPVDKSDIIPPAPPQLITSYEATNSAVQSISGWTEPGASIYLTQNSDTVSSVVAKDDGSFMFNGVNLSNGTNLFVAVAVDLSGNKSQPSETMTVEYSTKQPKLDVSTPTDKQTVNGSNPKIEVKGQTDPGNHVTVNGRVVIVSGEGNFSSLFNLNSGDNTITITATDRMGNQTKKDVTVTYSP